MRRLPCAKCRSGAFGGPQKEPLIVSSISPLGYIYRCSGCRGTTRLSLAQFLSLPQISPADLADPRGEYSRHPQFAEMVLSHFTSRPGPA